MRLAFSSIRTFSLALVLVVAGAACGDDDSGSDDFSRSGALVALPTDLEVPGRYDLYAGPSDGSALNQVVAMTKNADVEKARVSPDGTLIAFTADLEVDGILSAYVV